MKRLLGQLAKNGRVIQFLDYRNPREEIECRQYRVPVSREPLNLQLPVRKHGGLHRLSELGDRELIEVLARAIV